MNKLEFLSVIFDGLFPGGETLAESLLLEVTPEESEKYEEEWKRQLNLPIGQGQEPWVVYKTIKDNSLDLQGIDLIKAGVCPACKGKGCTHQQENRRCANGITPERVIHTPNRDAVISMGGQGIQVKTSDNTTKNSKGEEVPNCIIDSMGDMIKHLSFQISAWYDYGNSRPENNIPMVWFIVGKPSLSINRPYMIEVKQKLKNEGLWIQQNELGTSSAKTLRNNILDIDRIKEEIVEFIEEIGPIRNLKNFPPEQKLQVAAGIRNYLLEEFEINRLGRPQYVRRPDGSWRRLPPKALDKLYRLFGVSLKDVVEYGDKLRAQEELENLEPETEAPEEELPEQGLPGQEFPESFINRIANIITEDPDLFL